MAWLGGSEGVADAVFCFEIWRHPANAMPQTQNTVVSNLQTGKIQ
jgi:hypothetical protein